MYNITKYRHIMIQLANIQIGTFSFFLIFQYHKLHCTWIFKCMNLINPSWYTPRSGTSAYTDMNVFNILNTYCQIFSRKHNNLQYYQLCMTSHHSLSSMEYILDLSRKGKFTVWIQGPHARARMQLHWRKCCCVPAPLGAS